MEVESTQEDKSIEVVQQDSSSSSSSKRSRNQCDDVVESNVLSETPNKNEDEKECAAETVTVSIPQKPIKRARTAYFIFADEKRSEVQSKHPGEPVGIIARAIGQLWAALSDEERQVYQEASARERERLAHELAQLPPEATRDAFTTSNGTSDGLTFPVARIRKICKLDDEVNGISKEAAVLLTKCVELVTIQLGQECVKVARMQNRRKLLPDDVAQVCSTREQFHFLREDVKDLLREQKSGSDDKPKQAPASSIVAAANTKPLTAFFPAK